MTTEYEAIAQRLDWMDSQLSKDAATALREADRQQTRIERALVSGAEDMRKARNQILDMLVEIGNLREDRDKLIEGGSMTDYEAIAQRLASVNCPTATQQAVVDEAAAALQALSIFKTVAQGEVKKLRARLSLYNSGGFADADALAAKFIDLTAELDRLREERDALAAKPKELKP